MTEKIFWEDNCPLLQEIAGKEWEVYKKDLVARNLEHMHEPFTDLREMPCGLYFQREGIEDKLDKTYSAVAKEVLGDKIEYKKGTGFLLKINPLSICIELPQLGRDETIYLLLSTSVDGLTPEENIKNCATLIEARTLLIEKGYSLEFEYSDGSLDYKASPPIKSVAELKSFFTDIEDLVDKQTAEEN